MMQIPILSHFTDKKTKHMVCGRMVGLEYQGFGFRVSSLLIAKSVTMDKLFCLSKPQFPYL